MVKRITFLILSIFIALGSISVVSAENLVMDDKGNGNNGNIVIGEEKVCLPYKDVSIETEYLDSILFVYKKGGLSDSDYFRPNDYITRAEVFTILEKIFGNEDNLPKKWEDWSGVSTYKSTWEFDRTIVKDDYFASCSYNLAAHLVLNILDIEYLKNLECLDLSGSEFFVNYYNTLIVYGMPNSLEVDNIWAGITRSEFCQMVDFVYNNKDKWELPFDLKEETGLRITFERFDKDSNLDNYKCSILNDVNKLPKNIITSFNRKGFKIRVFPSKYKSYYNFTEEVAGMYVHRSKEIRLVDYGMDSFIHEIGHYVGFCNTNYVSGLLKFKNTEEYEKLDKVLGRSYYTTDNDEYFAEVFNAYINYSGKLKKDCPSIYEYIEKIVNNF